MNTKRLTLMIVTALLMGVYSCGTVSAATVSTKSKVDTKATTATKSKVVPKSTTNMSTKTATKSSIGKSTFKPLVTKPEVKTTTAKSATQSKAKKAATKETKAPKETKSTKTTSNKAQETTKAKVEHSPNVRVLLGNRKQDAKVGSPNGMTVLNGQQRQVGAYKATTIGVRGDKIAINGKAVDSVVTVRPTKGDTFSFEGKTYRGALTLRANSGTMMIINAVPLESYLYGVVPNEAVPSWPAAALEAQAVAARSYALHTMEQNKNKPYDVSPSTDHQVYGGVSGETSSTNAAVDRTKGMVMLYNNHPINALFHSDGGGYTENSANVWGNDVPYLKGVKDYINSNSTTSNWTVTTNRQALEAKLNAASKGVGKLKSIQLSPLKNQGKETSDRGVSGRIKSATFVGTSGKVTISGDSLRSILGLKSSLFDFYINHNPKEIGGKSYHTFTGKNDTVYIKGQGWGHGLGMSQWGAAEMAKQAKSGDKNYYQTILKHYYSGITLKKMY